MRSVRRVGEAGTHPTSTDHVSGPIQTASNTEQPLARIKFDAGAEASWATRKHRSFMIHAVAAAAARATCRAVVAERKRRPVARPAPATKLFATLRRAGRNSLNAAMHRLLPHTAP